MSTLFVEHLTVIDCAVLDASRGLVGESWIVDLELDGDLDAQSMVLDFSAVKKQLKRAIDSTVDHALLVPARAPELRLQQEGGALRLRFSSALGDIEHCSPAHAVVLIDAAEIDTAAVTAWLQPRLSVDLPPNVRGLRLTLRSEAIDGAYYHYVHGLKKHDGPCQRIAHGHRSRIRIDIDGVRDTQLEQQWALRWTDIYLGSREDVVARANGRVAFAYQSREGRYELTLPELRVELLDSDTTVECIAEQLARMIAVQRPGAEIRVRAYEGVHKGAVACVRA